MATLGLVAMHGHSLVAVSGGYALAAVSRLLWSRSTGSRVCGLQQLQHVDSVAVAHGLSCPHSMWDLPRPGIKPVSPALAGGFLTTGPPGKSLPSKVSSVLITANQSSFYHPRNSFLPLVSHFHVLLQRLLL